MGEKERKFRRVALIVVIVNLLVLFSILAQGCSSPEPKIDRGSEVYRKVVLRLYEGWRVEQDLKYYNLVTRPTSVERGQ